MVEPQPLNLEDPMQLLDEACARNMPVSLHGKGAHHELSVARSRVLGSDNHVVYLDRPQSIGEKIQFLKRQWVDVYVNIHGQLYTFSGQVREMERIVELNQKKTVVGMTITRPKTIKPGQRRDHFRVSLASGELRFATIHETNRDQPDACPLHAARYRGSLVDISAGGVSMKVDESQTKQFRLGDRLFIEFLLPELSSPSSPPSPVWFLVSVRQIRELLDGTAVRLGLKFESWPDAHRLGKLQNRIQKIVNTLQREQLKKAS